MIAINPNKLNVIFKRLLALILICSVAVQNFAQSSGQNQIRNYIESNIVPIVSIFPDSTNYSDLLPIGAAIGNSKVVMLGEQDHGDAATFLAKTRLIKYLHEKKGLRFSHLKVIFFV